MAARRPFCKWHRWKSIGFCLWPPSTCIWNLKLKFQSKLDLCSGNHVVYRQTDGQTDRRTDGRTRWIQYTPPPTSLGGGIIITPLGKYINRPSADGGSFVQSTFVSAHHVKIGPVWHCWPTLGYGLIGSRQPICYTRFQHCRDVSATEYADKFARLLNTRQYLTWHKV